MQDDWTSPSGSRWEPAAPPTARVASQVAARPVGAGPRRRYRRPVVAVLLTLLGAGAVTGGAAYALGDAPAAAAPAGSNAAAAGPDDHDGPHAHGHHGPRS